MKVEDINLITTDISNFLLILMGIALSLFTLLYSFILSKKDQLLELSLLIKLGNKDPLLIQKQNNALRYIEKLKIFNDKLVVFIVSTFILSFISWFFSKCFESLELKYVVVGFYVISFVTILIIAYFIYIVYLLFKSYIKDTRIK